MWTIIDVIDNEREMWKWEGVTSPCSVEEKQRKFSDIQEDQNAPAIFLFFQ